MEANVLFQLHELDNISLWHTEPGPLFNSFIERNALVGDLPS